MQKPNEMTSGNPLGLLLKFSFPLMLSCILQQLYTIVDGAVVGNFLGINAFAAVGAAGFFYWLVLEIVFGFSNGFGTVLAQLYGAKDDIRLNRALAISILLSVLISGILTAACILLTKPVLSIMNTPSEIVGDTERYLYVLFASVLLTFLYNLAGAVFRAFGDSKTPLYALFLSTIINIILDILLILFTGLGVAAVAVATLAAQLSAVLYCIIRLNKYTVIQWNVQSFRPEKTLVIQLLRLGAPIGARDCIAALGGAVIQYVINGYGTVFIAGVAAAKKIYSILFLVGNGMEGAVATYTAQNYGAKNYRRIEQGINIARRILVVSSVVISVLMFFFGRLILRLLISGDAAGTQTVLDIAYNQLLVCLILLPALYLLFLYRSALQGIGNSLMPMVSGLIEVVMRITAVLILPFFLGKFGVYVAEAAGWPIMAVQLYISYRIIFEKMKQPYEHNIQKRL